MELFKLVGSIVIDTSDAENAVDRVKGKAESSTKETGGFFSRVGKGFTGMAKGVTGFIGKVGGFKLVSGAMNMITNSFDSAISRVDTLNQFPRVLQQMGYGAEEADASIETLSDGIDGLPTTLDDIAGKTQRMITIFGDVDLATDTTLGLNNALLASGANTEVADRATEHYMNILSTGKVTSDQFLALQKAMPYAMGEVAESFGFTGASAEKDLFAKLQSGEITVEELNEKIIELSDGTGGFAEVAKGATRGIATSIQNLRTMVSRNVGNIIQAFDDWLQSAGFGGIPEIIDLIKEKVDVLFGGIVEAIPNVLDKILEVKQGFEDFFKAGELGKAVMLETFKVDAMEMFERGSEVIGGFIDGIFAKIPGIAETAGTIITTMIDTYSDMYPTIVESGKNILFKLIDGIVGLIPSLGETATNIIGSLADFILGNLPTILQAGWDILKKIASGIVEAIPELAQVALDIITRIKDSLMENLPAILETGKGILGELIQGILDFLPKIPGIALNIITTLAVSLMNNFPTILVKGGEILGKLIMGIVTAIPKIAETTLKIVIAFITGIGENLPKIVSAGVDLIVSLVKGFVNSRGKIREGAGEAIETVRNAFKEVDWGQIGKDIITGIANGIGEFAGMLYTKSKEVAGGVLDSIKGKLKINSPSKAFRDEVGRWIPEGIAVGIEDAGDAPMDALNKVMSVEGYDFGATMRHIGEDTPDTSGKEVNQTININSPREMNAIETARQVRKASRQFALEN